MNFILGEEEMNRKIITATAALMSLALLFTACAQEEIVSDSIKVPSDTLAAQPDGSIPILSGDQTAQLRGNIDRGFRLETYYTLGSGEAWPGDGIDGYEYLNDILAFYSEENVREIQVYIYLKEYYNKDLDQHALDQMKAFFEYIRSKNMSMVLRFAYESDQNSAYAPKQKQMLRHIEQLGAWIDQNIDLWYDTVTVFQIGMIGAWGEFGSSNVDYNRGKIVNAVCEMVPENTYIQGRYMVVTQEADEEYDARVGYHNDFLIGRPHPWNTAGGNNESEDYQEFEQTNKYRLNDGEMPWAGGTQEPNEYIDGKNLIQQLYEHHMTTLSLEHNYREFIKGGEQPESYYNIMRYRSEMLSLDDVKALGVPYYGAYFTDADGNPIQHSIYDYIADFLGYHLVLSDLSVTDSSVSLMVTNYGFGAPLNITGAELVLIDSAGNEESYPLTGLDVKTLCTYGQQTLTAETPHTLDGYTIGVRFNRHGGYHIQTANALGYENGVNVIRK